VTDTSGLDPLASDVYQELRRLAAGYLRRERHKSVQATELVHEAWLRLAAARPDVTSRSHVVALAAIAMRRLLVDRARRRNAVRRGAGALRVTLDDDLLATAPEQSVDLLALDRALTALAGRSPVQARIVELRYFGGLSIEEAAEALALSPATIKRHWTVARAFLLRELQGDDASPPVPGSRTGHA
jgi:RNA polymerase sigma-70 factor (ECF subfamily)